MIAAALNILPFFLLAGGLSAVIVFLVAVFFLPVRTALLFSPIVAGGGVAGLILAGVVQSLLLKRHPSSPVVMFREAQQFITTEFVAGLVCAACAAGAFLWIRRLVLARRAATKTTRQINQFA